jgi:DNA-directed RNA polymerase subunit RPC12/RpoP
MVPKMECPECGNKMVMKRWITNTIFGDWILFEILSYFLLIPLLLIGIVGWGIFGVLFSSIIVLSWGKRCYRCKECGYMTVVKINEIQP